MIWLDAVELPDIALAQLANWQKEVDAQPTHTLRVTRAVRDFRRKNTKRNKTFKVVKEYLDLMCPGPRRCCYCEDNEADEVEHIWPKVFYPERVFDWTNYLYACGTCNAPKGNRFAIYRSQNGTRHELYIPPKAPTYTQPPAGDPLLIDPRREDPFSFMELDLIDSFRFMPIDGLTPREQERADYTITLLTLNRSVLLRARENVFDAYKRYVGDFIRRRDRHEPQDELNALVARLKRQPHPTVWLEMQRMYRQYDVKLTQIGRGDLVDLFEQAPEALDW